MKYLTLFLTILLMHGTAAAEMRHWRQHDGSTFEGEYLRQKLGKAYFRGVDRKTHSIEISDLVVSDMKYLLAMIPPEVSIKVKTDESPEEGEYADPNTSYLQAKVTLTKTSRKPFVGTLNTEIYLIRREINRPKYDKTHRMLVKKKAEIRFPDTKKPSVEFNFSAKLRYIHFDNQQGPFGWTYDGYLVVVLGPDDEVLQTKTDLNWLEEEHIERLRKLKSYYFFDEKCKKVSTPRPAYDDSRTL